MKGKLAAAELPFSLCWFQKETLYQMCIYISLDFSYCKTNFSIMIEGGPLLKYLLKIVFFSLFGPSKRHNWSQKHWFSFIPLIIEHSQLLERTILKFNSSSIALLTICISKCCNNRVLYWVYTDPFALYSYWAIRENIAPAASSIQRIKSSNIALPGRTMMGV